MSQGSAVLSAKRNGPSSALTSEWGRVADVQVRSEIPPRSVLSTFLVEGRFGPDLMSLERIHWRIFLMAVLFVLVFIRLLFFG